MKHNLGPRGLNHSRAAASRQGEQKAELAELCSPCPCDATTAETPSLLPRAPHAPVLPAAPFSPLPSPQPRPCGREACDLAPISVATRSDVICAVGRAAMRPGGSREHAARGMQQPAARRCLTSSPGQRRRSSPSPHGVGVPQSLAVCLRGSFSPWISPREQVFVALMAAGEASKWEQ